MKFSSKIEKCGLSPIRKFHPYAVEAKKKGINIYHLNIGQPDVETPQEYFDAVKRFNDKTVEYAPSPGLPVMVEAVQEYYKKLNVNLESGDILITQGGSEALNFTINCVLDNDDEIIIPEPFYPNYNTLSRLAGATIRPIETTVEDGFKYTYKEKIESLINEHTRAMLITTPGNPTGVLLNHDEMKMLVDIAKEHDLFLIADEAYREFFYEGDSLSTFGEFIDEAPENLIIIDTVSKRFSACGARVGCIISKNRELIAHTLKCAQARLSVATLEQLASAELYNVGPEYFVKVRNEYKKRRDTLCSKLAEIPGVKFDVPKGAFYLVASLPIDDAEKFQQWLLEEFNDNGETVMFAPAGSMYQTPGRGINEVRMAYVLESEKIARAMDILKKAIEVYNNR
ncbi:MAG: pyridoxal phosphate-dependent aminotransferase [Eubacteriales bacterium]|nr:pyridoxal phosphate-dependent aminotransferase [Eubacteriales bacterium]